jgi:hypothetical protein
MVIQGGDIYDTVYSFTSHAIVILTFSKSFVPRAQQTVGWGPTISY